jgi:hypothetical protein
MEKRRKTLLFFISFLFMKRTKWLCRPSIYPCSSSWVATEVVPSLLGGAVSHSNEVETERNGQKPEYWDPGRIAPSQRTVKPPPPTSQKKKTKVQKGRVFVKYITFKNSFQNSYFLFSCWFTRVTINHWIYFLRSQR